MFILDNYQNNVSLQSNLTNIDFMMLQVSIMNSMLRDELVAIKDTNLKYIALSDNFINAFDKSGIALQNLTYAKLDLGELVSAETCEQEQRIINDALLQHSVYFFKKNQKPYYFLMRKRPLINPSTNDVVGILIIAREFELWRFRRTYIKELLRTKSSSNAISMSLSDQQQQIVFCLLLGFNSRKEIAEILTNITDKKFSETRVRNSLRRIYEKAECNSSAQLLNLICNNKIKIGIPIQDVAEGNYLVEI